MAPVSFVFFAPPTHTLLSLHPFSPCTRVPTSYCWAQQDKIKKLYSILTTAGFEVWLDIVNMPAGSVLNALSNAIDTASIVLICVSREYSESTNCRLEAEYAHEQNKVVYYLMTQAHFTKPKGWLGMLVGSKLWYNLWEDDIDARAADVLGAINKRAR
jgi:hypothetical protein